MKTESLAGNARPGGAALLVRFATPSGHGTAKPRTPAVCPTFTNDFDTTFDTPARCGNVGVTCGVGPDPYRDSTKVRDDDLMEFPERRRCRSARHPPPPSHHRDDRRPAVTACARRLCPPRPATCSYVPGDAPCPPRPRVGEPARRRPRDRAGTSRSAAARLHCRDGATVYRRDPRGRATRARGRPVDPAVRPGVGTWGGGSACRVRAREMSRRSPTCSAWWPGAITESLTQARYPRGRLRDPRRLEGFGDRTAAGLTSWSHGRPGPPQQGLSAHVAA